MGILKSLLEVVSTVTIFVTIVEELYLTFLERVKRKSFPRPTFSPGWNFVPRWRRIMLQNDVLAAEFFDTEALGVAVASVLRGTLSFLCAMGKVFLGFFNILALDGLDFDHGNLLAVTLRRVTLAALLLKTITFLSFLVSRLWQRLSRHRPWGYRILRRPRLGS